MIILLLLSGCTKAASKEPLFEFDSNGDYSGFSDIPTDYTAEQAEKDGCYVSLDSKTISGEKQWKDFIRDASNEKEASIRLVSIVDNSTYYLDIFYLDGFYRMFDSSSVDLKDHKYKYLLTVEGTMPNANKSGKVNILTDDKELSYYDVMWSFLSSDSHYSEAISPFKLIN